MVRHIGAGIPPTAVSFDSALTWPCRLRSWANRLARAGPLLARVPSYGYIRRYVMCSELTSRSYTVSCVQ